VQFILSPVNVTTISWKNIELIKMEGGLPVKIIIPGVLRKRAVNTVYKYYIQEQTREHSGENQTRNHVGLTLFSRIANAITIDDQHQRQSVDYVLRQ
jgi:hypothetical protein